MKDSVLAALAAGATLVTANRRLARQWRLDFDLFQREQGRNAWSTPAIHAWDDWLLKAHQESFPPEVVLNSFTEKQIWESIITANPAADDLLDTESTAASASDAWRLACQWELSLDHPSFQATTETQAFNDWARQFEARCLHRGWMPAVALARHVRPVAAELWLDGFDVFNPQQTRLLRSLGMPYRVVEPELTTSPQCYIAQCEDLPAEFRWAARWAREQVETRGANRVGVVIDGLAAHRREVESTFAETLGAPLFNISLGVPLRSQPLMAAALDVLDLAGGSVPAAVITRLLLSPFLLGGMTEYRDRARFDRRLRETKRTHWIRNDVLARLAPGELPRFHRLLEGLRTPDETLSPGEWADVFYVLLSAAGWPGERTLNSTERQAERRWQTVLDAYSALDLVYREIAYSQALRLLRRLLDHEVFQPETVDLPIQILESLQAAGSQFDALWVQGMTATAWPPAPAPHPFLPYVLQREHDMPNATPQRELAFARRIVSRLRQSAPIVVFSYARHDEDREQQPSPLLSSLPTLAALPPEFDSWGTIIRRESQLDTFEDAQGPALAEGQLVRSGTNALKMQAACPFQAFATVRLDARELEQAADGPDGRERGSLLHEVLHVFWRDCRDRSTLGSPQYQSILKNAVEQACRPLVLERGPRFAALERRRLTRLVDDWLQSIEMQRGDFEIVGLEVAQDVQLGNLRLHSRVDRIDRLADGSLLLIDYKTAKSPVKRALTPPRLDEPQLPLYAITANPAPGNVAFAQLRPGDLKLDSMQVDPAWQPALEELAEGLSRGEARVDPKYQSDTCKYCSLHSLCRIAEVDYA